MAGKVSTLEEISAWAVNLPRESATVHAILGPPVQHTHELELLRKIEHRLSWLAWTKTTDAKHNQNQPERYVFPWEPQPEGRWVPDPLDWDTAADRLGGDERLAKMLASM